MENLGYTKTGSGDDNSINGVENRTEWMNHTHKGSETEGEDSASIWNDRVYIKQMEIPQLQVLYSHPPFFYYFLCYFIALGIVPCCGNHHIFP